MNLTVFAGILLAVSMVTARFEIANLVEKKMNKRMKQYQPVAVEKKVQTTGGNLPPQVAVAVNAPKQGGKQAAGEADEPEVEKKMNKRMKQYQPIAVEKKIPTTGGNLPPQVAVEKKVPKQGGKQAAGEADEPEVEKK